MTDREKARDLGNQSAALARSIADVLNDTLDALEAAEADNARLREALREIVGLSENNDEMSSHQRFDGIHRTARAALAATEDTP